MRRLIYLPILILIFAISTNVIYACEALVSQRFQILGNICDSLSLNQICYGNNTLIAEFSENPTAFEQPSDTADLFYLNSLQTLPYNADTNEWGIALMKIQADLPNTLPGQAVSIIVMGDMNVTNEVIGETATRFDQSIPVITQFGANLRTFPNTNAPVAASVPANIELSAYARNATGDWLRVVYDDRPLWMSRSVIMTDADVMTLPFASARTPMQAFQVTSGIGRVSCTEAPDMMLIQSPNQYEVALEINGEEIRIGSTVSLTFDDQQRLQLSVLDGYARLESGTVVPTGFAVQTRLNTNTNDVESWQGLRPLQDSELERFEALEAIDSRSISYAVRVPTRSEIDAVAESIGYRGTTRPTSDTREDATRDSDDSTSNERDSRTDTRSRDDAGDDDTRQTRPEPTSTPETENERENNESREGSEED